MQIVPNIKFKRKIRIYCLMIRWYISTTNLQIKLTGLAAELLICIIEDVLTNYLDIILGELAEKQIVVCFFGLIQILGPVV